jgi:hypothetical protein
MTNHVTQTQFIDTFKQLSSQLASGWSEAATQYTNWVTTQETTRVVTETEKFNRFAAELGRSFQTASDNAATWGQAARDAGNTGIGNIMQKYADKFADQATNLMNQELDARSTLNGIANDAKAAMQRASDTFGGDFGRFLGPAFDAGQMMEGAVDWARTGNSDKFGGAAMGVLLSAGGALFASAVGAAFVPAGLGLALIGGLGALLGAASGDAMYEAFRDSPIINDIVSRLFGDAANWRPPVDPLVLDLDANGTRTGTGWVAPDDALLVRDINGNGSIDSGRELFGDNTLLPNGQTATNGFTALQQHDTNGDGQVNSQDSIYSQLRVWRDLNQDGVSQANELQTLTQAGIASIGVASTGTNTNLANLTKGCAAGNTHKRRATTRKRGCRPLVRSRLMLESATSPRVDCVDSYEFSSKIEHLIGA